jgi:hypothetical protein
MANSDSGKIASIANPVPLDMINSWLRGEYLISQNESTGYEFLGWALMLRGAYVYLVAKESEPDEKTGKIKLDRLSHWGICTIDIKDGDLTYQGARMGTLCDRVPEGRKIWYSVFSKLTRVPTSRDNAPDAYFGYFMHPIDNNNGNFEIFKLENSRKKVKKTDEHKASKDIYVELEIQFAPELTNTNLYNYLCDGRFDRDRHLASNSNSTDEISAIAQISLEKWNPKEKRGTFQPALTKQGVNPDHLNEQASIFFFPFN